MQYTSFQNLGKAVLDEWKKSLEIPLSEEKNFEPVDDEMPLEGDQELTEGNRKE